MTCDYQVNREKLGKAQFRKIKLWEEIIQSVVGGSGGGGVKKSCFSSFGKSRVGDGT